MAEEVGAREERPAMLGGSRFEREPEAEAVVEREVVEDERERHESVDEEEER